MDALETWESFISRFSRLTDIFLKRFIRSLILREDPAFRGSFLDHLNQAEKLAFISDANKWWEIRRLRDTEAHEYTDSEILALFQLVLDQADFIVEDIHRTLKANATSSL